MPLPWARPVFEQAKRLNKPLLVLGLRGTPLCERAVERLGASDVQTVLSQYECIQVYSRTHRDVDSALQSFVRLANNGQCSWPFRVILNPQNFRPFMCGTSINESMLPQFLQLGADAWEKNPERCLEIGNQVFDALEVAGSAVPSQKIDSSFDIVGQAELQYDELAEHCPRFIMAASLAKFRPAKRGKILQEISRSGMIDHLNGGVFRCALSSDWHLPALNKEIEDQANLLWATSAHLRYLKLNKTEENLTLATDLTNMATQLVKQIRSMAAGSYRRSKVLWTYPEFESALKTIGLGLIDRDIAASYWGVNLNGNIHPELQITAEPVLGDLLAKNVLSRHGSVANIQRDFGISAERVETVAETARLALERAQPPDLVAKLPLTLTQRGLALSALSQAAEFVEDANKLAVSMAQSLLNTDVFEIEGASLVCADFAMAIRGVLDFHKHIDHNPRYLHQALEWQKRQITLFLAYEGGFHYGLPAEMVGRHPIRFIDPRYWEDTSMPNYQGVSAANLAELSQWSQNDVGIELAAKIRDIGQRKAQTSPLAFLSYLESS